MKLSQYVYFDLSSDVVTAADITAFLGVEPDELRVRGSNKATPRPVPANHSLSIHCRTRATIDVQIQVVLQRLEPIRAKLIDLIATADVTARLIIVRYFNDEEGEEESFDPAITEDGELLERLLGQHQMLGWYLSVEQLMLIASLGAAIWADEYG